MLDCRELEPQRKLEPYLYPSHPLLQADASYENLLECEKKLKSLLEILQGKNDSGALSMISCEILFDMQLKVVFSLFYDATKANYLFAQKKILNFSLNNYYRHLNLNYTIIFGPYTKVFFLLFN